jgi:hypothetical protein
MRRCLLAVGIVGLMMAAPHAADAATSRSTSAGIGGCESTPNPCVAVFYSWSDFENVTGLRVTATALDGESSFETQFRFEAPVADSGSVAYEIPLPHCGAYQVSVVLTSGNNGTIGKRWEPSGTQYICTAFP